MYYDRIGEIINILLFLSESALLKCVCPKRVYTIPPFSVENVFIFYFFCSFPKDI